MSVKSIPLTIFFLFLLPISINAQQERPLRLKVSESAIATNIENRMPDGVSERFPPSVSKLYAFTRITGANRPTIIKHLWYYGDRLMTEVKLPVRSVNWRTYSSKRIMPSWTGKWKVVITTEDGMVLDILHFTIE